MRCQNSSCNAFLGDYEAVFEPTQFQMRRKPDKCPICSYPTPQGVLKKKKGNNYWRQNIYRQWTR